MGWRWDGDRYEVNECQACCCYSDRASWSHCLTCHRPLVVHNHVDEDLRMSPMTPDNLSVFSALVSSVVMNSRPLPEEMVLSACFSGR